MNADIKINCYSDKGLCVTGITAEQAQTILGDLGKAVTQYNPKLGGYVFSRKREDRIREIVAGLTGQTTDAPPAEQTCKIHNKPMHKGVCTDCLAAVVEVEGIAPAPAEKPGKR